MEGADESIDHPRRIHAEATTAHRAAASSGSPDPALWPARGLRQVTPASPSWSGTSTPTAAGRTRSPRTAPPTTTRSRTQVLPQDSNQQRIQLARRLAAEDPDIDLMSLDPPFTAEFANAGFLRRCPAGRARPQLEEQGTFKGAMDAATWEDKLVVFPFWSNTQVLWYRKSFVEKAGLDMSQPVTWDQIIDAAAENGGKIGVQANKYEGYVVWINALIEGAGGDICRERRAGRRRRRRRSTRDAGETAAEIIEKLAALRGRPADLACPTRAPAGSTFGSDNGLVHGQLDLHLAQLRRDEPRGRQGHRLRPLPPDGRGRGVTTAVRRHRHRRQRVLRRTRTSRWRPPPAWWSRRTRASTPR